ncbi:MarR family transcriptional regulator [Aquamicrobium sp. LC103]|uniref:MarR family winged helix-turn-helix transcriptional regulator n=1 Tax=Aquamicrobium sp. LC103 TaxID=1120658 RepID=UPI00063E7667|nr:MarR family transcriptional regulator [Aquamicrobium sp. LC103]TKT69475.1 MarR family transcriptional regulator [Aquamicrobium sp. LC103]
MEHRSTTSLIALRRILRATELNARALSRATGLTTAQLIVLEIVAAAGRISPKEISGKVGVGQATATSLVDKLVARGLVARTRSERDKRVVLVSPTAAGHTLLEAAPDPLQKTFASQFEALPDWQQAMIVATLEQVGAMLNAGSLDAAPLLDVGAVDRQSAYESNESNVKGR